MSMRAFIDPSTGSKLTSLQPSAPAYLRAGLFTAISSRPNRFTV